MINTGLLRNKAFSQLPTLLLSIFFIVPAASSDDGVSLDDRRSNTRPLTTTFTPNSTCFSDIRTKYLYAGAYPDLEIGCEGPGGDECCPDGWGKNRYFSPGLCPAGYVACTLPTTRQREETTNLCCPSNFDCPTEVSYGVCASSLNSWRTADYTDISGETSTATFMDVQATPIQIRFRDSDSSVVPRPTDSLQLPPPMTEAEKARQRGLSTGAKAGIGVGVGVGVLAVLFCVVPYIMRARKRRREENQQEQTLLGSVTGGQTENEPPPPYAKR